MDMFSGLSDFSLQFTLFVCQDCMGRAMWKRVFGHMRTAKVQISLRIRAGWSGPLLSADKVIGSADCFNGEQMPGWYFEHVEDDLNLHILHMVEGTFSLDLAHICKVCSNPEVIGGPINYSSMRCYLVIRGNHWHSLRARSYVFQASLSHSWTHKYIIL